jgi:predicted HicB family RNase H-like nuclease
MPASKAQQRAVSKYMKENYDELKIRVPKGQKAAIQVHAQRRDESLNGFVNRAINETVERDGDGVSKREAQREEGA